MSDVLLNRFSILLNLATKNAIESVDFELQPSFFSDFYSSLRIFDKRAASNLMAQNPEPSYYFIGFYSTWA